RTPAGRSPVKRAKSAQILLRRRGVRHGSFAPAAARALPAREVRTRWEANEPLLLAGVLRATLPRWRGELARTLRLFERLRADERPFDAEVRRRLRARPEFFPSGSTVDAGDERELEKVWVDGMRARRFAARGLYAKLSWIAHDRCDASLRIRFSFGAENLLDW